MKTERPLSGKIGNMLDCSIIIVNFNTKDLLKQCLESIAAKSKRFEIIVVDNGSIDGSVGVVKDFEVKLVENQTNLGFAKAVNQGIKVSEGRTILLLNSDTQVKSDAVKKMLEFEQKVGPAVIGAKMLNPDGTSQSSCFYLPTLKRAILEYFFGGKSYFSKYLPEGENLTEVEAVSGGAMMISGDAIKKIGLFDERYFMYFEDLDFCRRAGKLGIKVYFLPEAEVIHEHGASGKNLADFKNQWKRLIPSSKIYHGLFGYFAINIIMRLGQKIRKR